MIICGVMSIDDRIIDALCGGIRFCWITIMARFRSFGPSGTFDALLATMLMSIYLFNLRDPIS